MSNGVRRRPLSRLAIGQANGGPRARKPHKRALTSDYWAQQVMLKTVEAELERLEASDGNTAFSG